MRRGPSPACVFIFLIWRKRSLHPLILLADDLTGTLDTCVQLAEMNCSAVAFCDADGFFQRDTGSETACAVCLCTRHLPAGEAYRTTRRFLERLRQQGPSRLYLKTDSGLRGNIAAVFQAALDVFRRDVAFVPAYPGMGRTVIHGKLFIHGVPVSQSLYGRDPLEPIHDDAVKHILQAKPPLSFHEPDDPRDHPPSVSVYDAATDADLARIAARLSGRDVILAGCAGFAGFLPDCLGLPQAPAETASPRAPFLVVSGSASELSLRQLRAAQENGACARLLAHPLDVCRDSTADAEAVWRALKEGRNVLVEIARTPDEARSLSQAAAAAGLSRSETAERLVGSIANVVCGVMERGFNGTLFVIGGDTLGAVVRRLRIRKVYPLRELAPGIVLSKTGSGGVLISKSGSFGGERSVADLLSESRH